MMRRFAGLALAGLVLTGCSSSGGADGSSPATYRLSVFAAASLTDSFTTIAKQFEAVHPGVHVVLNFGASSALSTSIRNGAPADVFASAAPKNMSDVVQAGDARTSATFATNVLEIAVPPGNPAHITGLADLGRANVKVAVCDPAVPCGAVAAATFAKAGVKAHVVSQEADVKSTLTKAVLGEVDAAVVYLTDVRAAGQKVDGVPIPAALNTSTSYPIAVLAHAKQPTTAQQFVDYVLSAAAQDVLRGSGFGAA